MRFLFIGVLEAVDGVPDVLSVNMWASDEVLRHRYGCKSCRMLCIHFRKSLFRLVRGFSHALQ